MTERPRSVRLGSVLVLLCAQLLLGPTTASAEDPWCATVKSGLILNYREFNTSATPCSPAQVAEAGSVLGAAGFNYVSHEQTGIGTTTPALLNEQQFESDLFGKTAVVISTHGDGLGSPGIEYYDPNITSADLLNRLADLRSMTGYDQDDFSIGHDEPYNFILAYIICITPHGMSRHCQVLGTGCIMELQYCNSMITDAVSRPAGSYFNATVVGYAQSEAYTTACNNSYSFWYRMGGGLGPDYQPTVATALFTSPALADMSGYGSESVVLHCAGTDSHTTQFISYGAFADTAYCITQDELYSDAILLRGFVTSADYPSHPVVLDSLEATGGPGIWQPYYAQFTGSYALYDWEEIDITGKPRTSTPFASSARPSYLNLTVFAVPTDVDSLGFGESLSSYSGEALGVSESNCADFVVYSCLDALAEPVRAQIQADNPTKRVLKKIAPIDVWLHPIHSAQACRQAIADVVAANAAWNNNCGTLLNPPCNGHYYPVAPGPELYIVGGAAEVNIGDIGYNSLACGGHDCRSDLVIYDLDGDGLPDGPVSRIPASSVVNVSRAAAFAQDWNRGRNVDGGHKVLLLSGDVWNGSGISYPSPLLEGLSTDFTNVGYEALPTLKQSAYGVCDGAGRVNALKTVINGGVREIFGMGTATDRREWPGMFATGDSTQYTQKQRIVAWLPGCEMHDLWKSYAYDTPCGMTETENVIDEALMCNDTTRTGLAAAVSHLEPGLERGHQMVAGYLSFERKLAALSGTPVSVSRVAYNAVRALVADHPEFKDHALSVSTWGSYVIVPAKVTTSGGGCPYVDEFADGNWRPANTILGRSISGALVADVVKLPHAPTLIRGNALLRVRENEQEQTTLDRVGFVTVDHDSSVRAFPAGGGVRLGHLSAVTSVIDQAGRARPELLSPGDIGALVVRGDTLYLGWEQSGQTSGMHTNSEGGAVETGGGDFDVESTIKDDGGDLARAKGQLSTQSTDTRVLTDTGILVQASDGAGGWRTVQHVYPRERFAESVIDSIGAGPIRLIPLDTHRLRTLGRIDRVALDSLSVTTSAPLRAAHSRLGDVRAAVATAGGGTTTLVPGDTLNLEFAATNVPAGKVRDYFVVSRGVYSTIGAQGAGGAIEAVHPYEFALGAARPNPSIGRVTFDYTLGQPSQAVLSLYSVAGRLIRTVASGQQAAGPHSVLWDGTDDHGQRVRPGVFFYRLRAGNWSSQRKLVVIEP